MIQGKIIGEVWATKKFDHLQGKKMVLVAQRAKTGFSGRVIVAMDNMDAREGDEVVVSFGSGARNVFAPGSRTVLIDAAVSQIIDRRPIM